MYTQPTIDDKFIDVTNKLVDGRLLNASPSARIVCYFSDPNVQYFVRIHRNGIEYIPVEVLTVGERYYIRS